MVYLVIQSTVQYSTVMTNIQYVSSDVVNTSRLNARLPSESLTLDSVVDSVVLLLVILFQALCIIRPNVSNGSRFTVGNTVSDV